MTVSALEIAAIFQIKDSASEPLGKIANSLKQMSIQLKDIVTQTQAAVDKLGTLFGKMETGLTGQITQTNQLAAAWDRVATSARLAQSNMAGRSLSGIPNTGAGASPNAMLRRPGGGGGGGHNVPGLNMHAKVPMPYGNSYIGPGMFGGGIAGNVALAAGAAGFLGAELDIGVLHQAYNAVAAGASDTSGGMPSDDVIERQQRQFRDIVIEQAKKNLVPYNDVAKLAASEIRLGGGIDDKGNPYSFEKRLQNLPSLITASAVEARQKGVSLEDAGVSFIKFAHEMKEYNPDELAKIYPALSYLSTKTDQTPAAILRASAYHLPQNAAIGIDPIQDMVLQISMERAGAINTKSGTWLAAMAERALPYSPGTHGDKAEREHNKLLKDFGLIDSTGLPTWFKDGKPDELAMLKIVHDRMPWLKQQPDYAGGKLADATHALFGATGARAVNILADDKVFSQVEGMERGSRAYNPAGYIENALKHDPMAQLQKAWLDLEGVLMEVADKALPPVISGVQTLDSILTTLSTAIKSIDAAIPNWLRQGIVTGVGNAGKQILNPVGNAYDQAKYWFGSTPARADTLDDGKAAAAAEARINRFTKWFPRDAGPSFNDRWNGDADKTGKQSYNVIVPPASNPKPITLAATLNIDGTQLAQTIASKLADIYENSPNAASSNDLSHLDLNGGLSGM